MSEHESHPGSDAGADEPSPAPGASLNEEEELIRRARAGDPAAFDEIVAAYGRLILSVTRNITGNAEDAQDASQETFLRLYRALGRVDPSRPLKPYVVQIAVNTARNHVTRSPARHETEVDERHLLGVPSQGPDRRLLASEIRGKLDEALDALTLREREVFVLRDLEELTSAEIGEIVGISDVTVRRLSGIGRRKIAEWLKRHSPELLTEKRGTRPSAADGSSPGTESA